MASMGTVLFWHSDQGWGVVDSADMPTGCWAHFTGVQAGADVPASGFRELSAQQPVLFTGEAIPQDGYEFRAVAVWPAPAG